MVACPLWRLNEIAKAGRTYKPWVKSMDNG